jgi:hypothetical protein
MLEAFLGFLGYILATAALVAIPLVTVYLLS